MANSNRRASYRFGCVSETASPATDVERRSSPWFGFVMRSAAMCLCAAAFLCAIDWLHRPIDWKCALSNIPLRPEARICGMVGDLPMVGIPGMPLRLFGVDVRQPGHSLAGDLFGESVGDLICGEPVFVQLPYSELADEQMPLIAQAPTLRSLSLDGTRISDAGLTHLLGLKSLETLSIGDTDITDKGAEILGRLSSLKYLDVRGTRLTGAALTSLAGLPRLEAINLSRTALDAGQLANLRLLLDLQSLILDDVSLGDDDVEVLGTVTSLRRLQLRGTRVTEAGVARLAALIPLETCEIEGAMLTRGRLDALRASHER